MLRTFGMGNYYPISTGTYGKLAKAYGLGTTNRTNDVNKTGKGLYADAIARINGARSVNPSSQTVKSLGSEAKELAVSANKLTNTGQGNIFASAEGYDKDAAYKAVSDFISDYNETLDKLGSTYDSTVRNTGDSMKRMTGFMKNSLEKAGITIGSDNRLSLNEETFKNADFNKVKSLFNGGSSYAGIVSTSASRIAATSSARTDSYANALYGSGLYGNPGLYGASGLYGNMGLLGSLGLYGNSYSPYSNSLSGLFFNGLF